jgi:hypothetical protein
MLRYDSPKKKKKNKIITSHLTFKTFIKYNNLYNTFKPHTEMKSSLTGFAVTDKTVNGIETQDNRVEVNLRFDTSDCFNNELICSTAIFSLS